MSTAMSSEHQCAMSTAIASARHEEWSDGNDERTVRHCEHRTQGLTPGVS